MHEHEERLRALFKEALRILKSYRHGGSYNASNKLELFSIVDELERLCSGTHAREVFTGFSWRSFTTLLTLCGNEPTRTQFSALLTPLPRDFSFYQRKLEPLEYQILRTCGIPETLQTIVARGLIENTQNFLDENSDGVPISTFGNALDVFYPKLELPSLALIAASAVANLLLRDSNSINLDKYALTDESKQLIARCANSMSAENAFEVLNRLKNANWAVQAEFDRSAIRFDDSIRNWVSMEMSLSKFSNHHGLIDVLANRELFSFSPMDEFDNREKLIWADHSLQRPVGQPAVVRAHIHTCASLTLHQKRSIANDSCDYGTNSHMAYCATLT